jgi:aromatic-L-amino-acid decarboxylase
MIRRHVALTQELATWVADDPRFEIVAPHPMNLLCIALTTGNEATDALIERANATGSALFTRTVLDGRVACRVSVGGRTTERRHVEEAWALLRELA